MSGDDLRQMLDARPLRLNLTCPRCGEGAAFPLSVTMTADGSTPTYEYLATRLLALELENRKLRAALRGPRLTAPVDGPEGD